VYIQILKRKKATIYLHFPVNKLKSLTNLVQGNDHVLDDMVVMVAVLMASPRLGLPKLGGISQPKRGVLRPKQDGYRGYLDFFP
jgi:hypothetical protein